MRLRRTIPVFIVAAMLCGGCGGASETKPLLVFAAASLADPLDSLLAVYEASTGINVHVSYGASGTLAQQIRAGAGANIFFSADTAWIERLAEDPDGHVEDWWPVLSNQLVIVTGKDNSVPLTRIEDLLNPAIERLAIADPQSAPVGRYAQAALQSAGLYESLIAKIVFAENATAVVTTVRAGHADAGIVYATDAAQASNVVVRLGIPASLHPPIVYGLALMSPSSPVAEDLSTALRSRDAQVTFAGAGFLLLGDTAEIEVDH